MNAFTQLNVALGGLIPLDLPDLTVLFEKIFIIR